MNRVNPQNELISAAMDGELTLRSRFRLSLRRLCDRQFRQAFNQARHQQRRFEAQMSRIENTPVPEAISRLLTETANSPKSARSGFDFFQKPLSFGALAASATLVITGALLVHSTLQPVNLPTLSQALNQLKSGESAETQSGRVSVVLAYPSEQLGLCRLIRIQADAGMQAVTCRDGNSWATQIERPAELENSDGFRLADGGLSSDIEAFITNTRSGDILTLQQEMQLQ